MLIVCIGLEPSMGIDIYKMPVSASDILENITSLHLTQVQRSDMVDASPHLCLSGIGSVNALQCGALQQETTSCQRKPHAGTGRAWRCLPFLAGHSQQPCKSA